MHQLAGLRTNTHRKAPSLTSFTHMHMLMNVEGEFVPNRQQFDCKFAKRFCMMLLGGQPLSGILPITPVGVQPVLFGRLLVLR